MKTFMFPGQGAQTKGMGGDLFDHFKELTDKADSILGYSIKKLCLEDPRGELNKTQFTQPALYTVNALSYFKKLEETGKKPDFLAGHSLGEFNALMAAECFDFETGLKLVQKRGELMGQVTGGGMAAMLNASKEEIETTLKKNGLNNVYLANYNSPSQIVISGSAEEIAKAEPLFKKGKIRFYPLNTSGAFHSKFMQDAMEQFKEYLKGYAFSELKTPVISNVTARPYENAAILDTLSRQIASTVQWSESVQYLIALGRRRSDAMEFEELGPGNVLTTLVETIKKQTPNTVLDQYFKQDNENGGSENAAPKKSADAAEKVSTWNQKYPIGTKVKSTIMDYDDLETRTEAVVLFGHRAAVYMKGYNGYFDLDEVVPI